MEEITIDEPTYIIDGYVTINLPTFGVSVRQKVKQVKGRGVADADQLKNLNHYHVEILYTLLKMEPQNSFTGLEIREWVKLKRDIAKDKHKFIDNNWMRPISELFRKGILVKAGKRRWAPLYTLHTEKARRALVKGEFEWKIQA